MRKQVTKTSLEAHTILVQSGKKISQEKALLKIISNHQPITARKAFLLSGFELSSVKRAFTELKNSGCIKVAFTGKCNITGVTVNHYALSELATLTPDKIKKGATN